MLATLSGTLALLVGLAVLLLPLLAPEMSRPRDSAWGAVVLLLGLVLVTSAERFTGSPMLAVLCGGLLIGRLGGEVLHWRWTLLSPEEQQRLWSLERWQTSLSQLAASSGRLLAVIAGTGSSLLGALQRPAKAKGGSGKRWVRAEPAPAAEPDAQPGAEPDGQTGPEAKTSADQEAEVSGDPTVVVSSFQEIDRLIEAASGQAG
ncbi:MAG: hypothetical protein EBX49_07635 [Synechococcaceae bacterium WB8_1B_136]|nr:hypothetical protein [Synechococcaceae bacterium WB8_1B_136]